MWRKARVSGVFGARALKAFAAIDLQAQKGLQADLNALMDKFNTARDGTLVIPSEYLEVVVSR